jgi:hypothetical protein
MDATSMKETLLLALGVLLAQPVGAQLPRPDSWRLRTDGATSDTVYYVQMPPGWHVTTGPGSLLYDSMNQAKGRYAVSMEVFLFPKPSEEGYGLFFGGTNLDGASPSYVAFVVRRDGAAMVEQVDGSTRTTLVPWTPNAAVKPHPGGDANQLNTLRVSVEPDSVRFEANGSRVVAVPRGDLPLDGTFGFRVGPGINLHISNLDHTLRLAPAARRRPT